MSCFALYFSAINIETLTNNNTPPLFSTRSLSEAVDGLLEDSALCISYVFSGSASWGVRGAHDVLQALAAS